MKTCKTCSKPFKGRQKSPFCSIECRTTHYTRLCACGKQFVAKHTFQLYCGLDCYTKEQVERQKKNNKARYGHDFNPCSDNSFYESEAERRVKLGRKRL